MIYTIAFLSNVPVGRVCADADVAAAVGSEETQRNESTHILNHTNATLYSTVFILLDVVLVVVADAVATSALVVAASSVCIDTMPTMLSVMLNCKRNAVR